MRRVLLLTLTAALAAPAVAPAAPPQGRLLVKLHPGVSASAAAAPAGARPTGIRIPGTGTVVVAPRPGHSTAQVAAALRRDPRVAGVRAEGRYELRHIPNDPALAQPEPQAPAVTVQWWATRQGLPAAWDLHRGEGAKVAILDTGIDAAHPEFAGRIVSSADFDDDPDHGGPLVDEAGHGTHVASMACAVADNGQGLAGAGYGCELIVVKTDLTESSVARSIRFAADAGAHAINMSFGTDGSRPASDEVVAAIDYALARNVVMAAAAADEPIEEQGDPSNVLQPTGTGASIATGKGLSVTAANAAEQRAGFAGRGTQISMAAYGAYGSGGPSGLLGAFPGQQTDLERGSFTPPTSPCRCRTTFNGDNRYAYVQGTSMASPVVAAVGALIRRLNPDLSGREIVRLMKESARGDAWNPELGWGILDAGAALQAATQLDRRAPTSKLRLSRKGSTSRLTQLRWSGRDTAPAKVKASGVAYYELFRSLDGGRPRRLLKTSRRALTVKLRRGSRYSFYTVAVDAAGNREAAPSAPDVRVLVGR